MKAAVLVGCFLTVLSLTETTKVSRPVGTMSPAHAFSPNPTPGPNTTTPGPTPANTTTPGPTPANTTTPGPTPANTTTPGPTTTTANTTTPGPTPANTTTPGPTPANTTTPGPTTANTTTTNTTTPGPTTANTTTPGPTPANTTTPGPTTTTTSTTAHPTTAPSNKTVGNYTLMEGKVICLMAQMALKIRLQTREATGSFIVQPQNTTVKGGCKDPSANLTLVFPEGFISFLYNKSVQDDRVYVNALRFNLSYAFVKGGDKSHSAENTTVRLFSARVGHSYSCRAESLDMGHGLFLDVTQDRMQAFNLTMANEFGSSDPCPADQPNYSVAVAVGVTLLVLVLLVLLVYVLGRRKRTDGYQSL